MCVKSMTKVWEWSLSEGNNRLVLLALADWADDDGYCWPGIKRLASKCRISERTVQRCLSALQSAGDLLVEANAGRRTSTGMTNRYQVTIKPRGDRLTPVAPVTSRGDKSGSEGVTPLSPNPSVEPSDKPSDSFEAFWKAYPKKKSRGTAEKAWKKIPVELIPKIMVAVETHKQSAAWAKDGGQFIPHPASWLNAKGWEDEIIWTTHVPAHAITNDGIWQGYLDSLCREWNPTKPDLKYAENALRKARSHVSAKVIKEYVWIDLRASWGILGPLLEGIK